MPFARPRVKEFLGGQYTRCLANEPLSVALDPPRVVREKVRHGHSVLVALYQAKMERPTDDVLAKHL